MPSPVDTAKLESLIAQAKASSGAETANTQKFIERLCDALGVPAPDFSTALNSENTGSADAAIANRAKIAHLTYARCKSLGSQGLIPVHKC